MPTLRISGLASGMDTDQSVEDAVKAASYKKYGYERDKIEAGWIQDAYSEIGYSVADSYSNLVDTFGVKLTTFGDVNKSMSDLSWMKTTTSSNSNAVEIKTLDNSANGTYSINITNIATNYSIGSTSAISSGDTENLVSQFSGISSSDIINFEIVSADGSSSKEFLYTDLANTSLNDIVSDINSSDLGVTVNYDSTFDRFFIQSDATGSTEGFTINTLNSSNGLGSATVDFLTGSNDILNLNLTDGNTYTGEDALFDYGGITGLTSSSNNVIINNTSLTLKSATTEPVTLTVGTDTDTIYDKINGFVDEINLMLENIYSVMNENRDYDYNPLVSEEEEELTEDEVNEWNEKAKEGLLGNDVYLTSMYNSIKNDFYTSYDGLLGDYKKLSDLGISINTRIGSSTRLEIDETVLRTAISNDSNAVMDFFLGSDDETQTGFLSEIGENVVNGLSAVVNASGYANNEAVYRNVSSSIITDFIKNGGISTLDKDMDDLADLIEEEEDKLDELEEYYYDLFSTMETQITQLSSQSSSIESLFA